MFSATHHAVVSGLSLLTHSALSLAAFEQRNNHIRAVHQHGILPRHGVGVHLLRQIRMHIGAVAVHIPLGNGFCIGKGPLLILAFMQNNKLPASIVVPRGSLHSGLEDSFDCFKIDLSDPSIPGWFSFVDNLVKFHSVMRLFRISYHLFQRTLFSTVALTCAGRSASFAG